MTFSVMEFGCWSSFWVRKCCINGFLRNQFCDFPVFMVYNGMIAVSHCTGQFVWDLYTKNRTTVRRNVTCLETSWSSEGFNLLPTSSQESLKAQHKTGNCCQNWKQKTKNKKLNHPVKFNTYAKSEYKCFFNVYFWRNSSLSTESELRMLILFRWINGML